MLPVGAGCSVIRPVLGPWFGRLSDGFLVLDGCFVVALSVAASVSTTDVVPVSFAVTIVPVDDIVVDSAFVVVASLLELSSSELQ